MNRPGIYGLFTFDYTPLVVWLWLSKVQIWGVVLTLYRTIKVFRNRGGAATRHCFIRICGLLGKSNQVVQYAQSQ
jgi:hypothetical protein